MKQEDIIRMAREAGLHLATDVNWMPVINLAYAEKFAALVAAASAAAENEECAKVFEEMTKGGHPYMIRMSNAIAAAIRARRQA